MGMETGGLQDSDKGRDRNGEGKAGMMGIRARPREIHQAERNRDGALGDRQTDVSKWLVH